MVLTIPADYLVRILSSVTLAASSDTTRPALNAVLFDVPHMRVVATNGHALALYTIDPARVEHTGDDYAPLISLWDCARILKALGKRPPGVVAIEFNGKAHVTIRTHGATLTAAHVDATYPPVDQVVPAAWSREALPEQQIGLSGEYLALAARSFALGTERRNEALRFDFGSALDPVRITDGGALTWIVMPMKTDVPARERGASRAEQRRAKLDAAREAARAKRAADEAAALAIAASFAAPAMDQAAE